MDLEALRAQARAVASRMEARISTALGENRELTSAETEANTADEGELGQLKADIATAEATAVEAPPADPQAAAIAAAVAGERTRILALADLCPSSVLATPLRTAIEKGVEQGAFAIDIATAAKARGATLGKLASGAVSADQLPDNAASGTDREPKKGADRGKGILALAAAAGHAAAKHLAPAK